MTNKEIVSFMQERGIKHLAVVVNEDDDLGVLLCLTPSGKLNTYEGKTAGAKFKAWGYIKYNEGYRTRVPFGGTKAELAKLSGNAGR